MRRVNRLRKIILERRIVIIMIKKLLCLRQRSQRSRRRPKTRSRLRYQKIKIRKRMRCKSNSSCKIKKNKLVPITNRMVIKKSLSKHRNRNNKLKRKIGMTMIGTIILILS